MRRASTSRAFVAGVVILAMVLSMTILSGAQGPLVKITSPAAKATVQGVIEIRADVNSSHADYVILVVDGDRPGSTNSLPASFEFDTRELSDGPHRVSVEAYSGFGLIGASKAITIYVKNGSGHQTVAKQPARTQVAAKLGPAKLVATADLRPKTDPLSQGVAIVKPATPARRLAGGTPKGAPLTVAAAEGVRPGAALYPTMVGPGPTPGPARSVAVRPISPRSSTVVVASSPARAASRQMAEVTPSRYRTHTIMVDGRPVEFDVVPVVKDGRMQGGFRALFDATGARVTWLSKSRTARSQSASLTVEVPAGSQTAWVNGRKMDMGSTAAVQEGRTIIPVRFFAEATGSSLGWDYLTGIAYVRTPSRAMVKRND